MVFASPGERPPRVRHRRHASLSLVTLGPASLDELRAREDLELRATRMLGQWLSQRATTIDLPVDPPLRTTASKPLQDGPPVQEPHASVPLPPSDDEDMDMSSSRKRARETESEDEEPTGRRKQPSTSPPSPEQHTAASCHVQQPDHGSAISPHSGETAATSSPPATQDGGPPKRASATSRHPAESTAASSASPPSKGAPGTILDAPSAPGGGASPAASASEPAANENAADAMELTDATPTVSSHQGPDNPAARFLKDPPCQPSSRPKPKGKKKKQKRKEPAHVSRSSPGATDDSRRPPATLVTPSAPTTAVERATPSARESTTYDFTLVQSKRDRRRARALETAALPVDPAVVGTVLFRPSAPGGTFRGAPRLSLAATLSSRPGVAVVRVNHKRNIVAADTTTRECLQQLLAVTDLHGIPVTARLPAERGKSTGFLHGVVGLPADTDLLGAIESSVPVLSATREESTITIRFAGPVPPEHVRLFKLGFRMADRLHLMRQEPRGGRLLPESPLQELRRPP
nr:nascent polypeptide-associated complex subunit alpha, muscle-specific form-like [Dermacentor andersoni]XP_050025190.1 nascent polypeptide-associated complex subunit alpha, muscle-specific form-like [Dermacentor andersoni]